MLDGAGPLLFPLCGTCDLEDLAPILISKKIDRCGRIKVFGESYRFAVDAVHNERFQTIGDPTGEFPCNEPLGPTSFPTWDLFRPGPLGACPSVPRRNTELENQVNFKVQVLDALAWAGPRAGSGWPCVEALRLAMR